MFKLSSNSLVTPDEYLWNSRYISFPSKSIRSEFDLNHTVLTQKKKLLQRITLWVIIIYVSSVVSFFFLAQDQLHFQEATKTEFPTADSATIELTTDCYVDQIFFTTADYLSSFSVKWGTFDRTNSGTIGMDLHDLTTHETLLSQTFDVSQIVNGGVTTLTAETPLAGLAGHCLMLSIYCLNGQPGSSATPMMNFQSIAEDSPLVIMGNTVSGSLCMSITSVKPTWIGAHYWETTIVLFVLILLILSLMWNNLKKGKPNYFVSAIEAIQRYRFLIRQLVARDFKTKYKRSVLGVLWSFLNPLLMMVVQYFIFSTLFKSDIPNYAAYLLIGIVCFNFFSEVCGMSLFAILGNASLITKVYMPKYIYPLTRSISSCVNLVISLLPLVIVCFFTGVHFQKSALLAFYFLICLFIFSLGMGFLLSTTMVFFRDTQFLWNILNTVWMYATAIFYPETILPENLRFVLQINPVYHFIKNIRICILDGVSPAPSMYVLCIAISFAMLLVGALIFKKNQDKFVLYL